MIKPQWIFDFMFSILVCLSRKHFGCIQDGAQLQIAIIIIVIIITPPEVSKHAAAWIAENTMHVFI